MYINLVISSFTDKNISGAELYVIKIANQFISNGYRVTIVTFDNSECNPSHLLSSKVNLVCLNRLFRFSKLFKTKNRLYINFFIYLYNFKLIRLFNILKRIFSLRSTFRKLNPDLIISFIEITNITTIIAATGLKIPIIVSERTNPYYYKIPFIYNKFRDFFYPKAKLIVTQTQSAASYFHKLNQHQLRVIPNSVKKPINSKIELLPKVVNIVSVGRLCKSKDFGTLIKAFSSILHDLEDNADLNLTIYGEGPDRNQLEELIKFYNLESKVSLPGFCDEIEAKLLSADLFVFPSEFEGFPNALAEAMAIGLPVIASNCAGNVELVQDLINGRLFPIGDYDLLASLIKELISDYPQRVKLSIAAKEIVEQFNEDKIFTQWEEAINDLYKLFN